MFDRTVQIGWGILQPHITRRHSELYSAQKHINAIELVRGIGRVEPAGIRKYGSSSTTLSHSGVTYVAPEPYQSAERRQAIH